MVEDAGAAAVAVHGRTAAQSYTGESDWTLIARVAETVRIPVFGSGDCVEPDADRRAPSRIRRERRARRPRRAPESVDLRAGRRDAAPDGRRPKSPPSERGQFLLDYIDLLLARARGRRRRVPPRRPGAAARATPVPTARGRERWVINKLRALGSWYTKGLDGGSQLRVAINSAESIPELR